MTDITRLVLTRKTYQSINIGGMVTVTVEEIRGKTVRISVELRRGGSPCTVRRSTTQGPHVPARRMTAARGSACRPGR